MTIMDLHAPEWALASRGIWLSADILPLCYILMKTDEDVALRVKIDYPRSKEEVSVFAAVFRDAVRVGGPLIVGAVNPGEFTSRDMFRIRHQLSSYSKKTEHVVVLNNCVQTARLVFRALGDVICEKGVEELHLVDIRMHHTMLADLSHALCAGPLKRLHLHGHGLGTMESKPLAIALRSKESCLTFLDLTSCGIRDVVLEPLATALYTNTSLQTLYLMDNHIRDDGALMLGAMLQVNRTLRELRLEGTRMSDAAFPIFTEALRHNHALDTFTFTGDGFLEMGVVRSFAAMIADTTTLRRVGIYWRRTSPMSDKIYDVLVGGLERNHSLLDFMFNGFSYGLCVPTLKRNRIAFVYLHSLQRAAATTVLRGSDAWKADALTPTVMALLEETQSCLRYL